MAYHVGDEVTVGHGAVTDYAEVDGHLLVGMGSAVTGDATVVSNCVVAANAVARQGQRIPQGRMAYGVPAEMRPLTDEQIGQREQTHQHYVELDKRFADE